MAEFHEPRQPYGEYAAEHEPIAPDADLSIYLQPISTPSTSAPKVETLAEFMQLYYRIPVKVLSPVDAAEIGVRSRGTERPQLLTGDILAFLEARKHADALCLLGVTAIDLYPGDGWNYVFGEAALEERVGVYSTARHDPAFFGEAPTDDVRSLILRRNLGVMVHETGHMLGLAHCKYFRCVMQGSNSLEESDSQPLHLCPVCLKKVHHLLGLPILERYRGLQQFYEEHGLSPEARWMGERIDWLVNGAAD